MTYVTNQGRVLNAPKIELKAPGALSAETLPSLSFPYLEEGLFKKGDPQLSRCLGVGAQQPPIFGHGQPIIDDNLSPDSIKVKAHNIFPCREILVSRWSGMRSTFVMNVLPAFHVHGHPHA